MRTLKSVMGVSRRARRRFRIAGLALAMAVTSGMMPPADDSPSGYIRALELYKEGRFEQAATILEAALRSSPTDPVGYHSLLGWCRYRQGRNQSALSSFEAALSLSAENADALEGLARTAARLGRSEEAMRAILTLSRLHPEIEIGDVASQVLDKVGAFTDHRLGRSPARTSEPAMVSRARGDYFEVRREDGSWTPLFVKGINLGAALPGRFPAQFPRDKALYARWLGQMADMGANVVRLYTLLPPEFYEALHEHNAARSGAGVLWLAQGVWTELPEDDVSYDAPEFRRQFIEEMERVIDAVHGNIVVAHRRGHAFGLYGKDVSGMTLCYILGREWEPYSVAAYDESRPHPASFRGDYFTLEDGTPTEAWFASILDHAVKHEMSDYSAQRPVAFTNWPTLDPIHHPTEATKKEEVVLLKKLGLPQEPGTVLEYDNDGVDIDANKIVPTSLTPAGTFASYHAYPYYPDFMNVDPGYLKAADSRGPSNYIGYLRDLKAHHRNMPLLIAEVGVPTSRGISHHQPQGWNHGGHTEAEQGEIDARLMENIHEARCAGGILFAWLDEWFKKNWLVIAFEVPWDNNKNWLNILDPEQNYGLMACKPGSQGWKIVIDGKGDDWKGVPAAGGDGSGPLKSLRVTHDEAYIYMRLDTDRLDWDSAHYALGIDTYGAAEGDHRMPFGLGLTTPTGMEFVVDLTGPATSRVLCDVPYDLHTNRFSRPWKSSENSDGIFTEMLAETNRRRVGRDGTIYPAIIYSRSPLRYGTMDTSSPKYDDLVEWAANTEEGFLELRLGWNLLNVTDPSTRQVLDDPVPPRGGAGHTTTDGFRFYVAAYRPQDHKVLATLPAADGEGRFSSGSVPFYTWEPWEEPTWHSYLKKSYFILKDRLAAMEPVVPTGVAR
jgi:tetratricopeptide (TPR) repeat protein